MGEVPSLISSIRKIYLVSIACNLSVFVIIIDCRFEAFDNTFAFNKAPFGNGGAINHNLFNAPPDFHLNKFSLNDAKQYQSYIQYPQSFSLISMDRPTLRTRSGRKLEQSLMLGIIDKNNQALQEDSTSIVSIKNDDQ